MAESRKNENGLYVVFDSIDGAGSSTVIGESVIPWAESIGYELGDAKTRFGTRIGSGLVTTREPGGTQIGENFRELLLHRKDLRFDPHTEYDLFRASRRELSKEVVTPQLLLGKFVVQERNYNSSIAYQGFGRGLNVSMIERTSKKAVGERMANPDATVILRLDPEIALERMANREGVEKDKIEEEDLAFFYRVHHGYDVIAEKYNYPVVDASKSAEEVGQAVIKTLSQNLNL